MKRLKHVRGNSFGNESNRKIVNSLIDEVNRANNISYKGGVRSTKNLTGTNVFIPRQKGTQSIKFAIITQGISYDGNQIYKITVNGEEDQLVVGFAISGSNYSVAQDYRTLNRWYNVGDIVPVILYTNPEGVSVWVFLNTFTPLTDEDGYGSLAWSEEDNRLMAIFKNEPE